MKFRELYLDTTYIMPFFYLDINVKGFSRGVYKEVIKSLERIHVSEMLESCSQKIQSYCISRILVLKQSIGMLFSERWE